MTVDEIAAKYGFQADAAEKKTDAKKAEAKKLFDSRKKEALNLAKTLQAKITKYSGEPYYWGSASSLGHVIEELKNISNFMG